MRFEKRELFGSYSAAAIAQAQYQKEGWEVDPENPPSDFGFRYELIMFRDDEPKPTRAEILAKAREAKAANKNGMRDA